MFNLWPWIAVAGSGAIHGLNPATGWMFAAVWGVTSGSLMLALAAVGIHTATMLVVTGAIAYMVCRGLNH